MTSVGPFIASLGALVLFGIGIIRLFFKDLPGNRWKQAGLCFGGGLLLLLLLTAYFWSEQRHVHYDSDGEYDDRYQNGR